MIVIITYHPNVLSLMILCCVQFYCAKDKDEYNDLATIFFNTQVFMFSLVEIYFLFFFFGKRWNLVCNFYFCANVCFLSF